MQTIIDNHNHTPYKSGVVRFFQLFLLSFVMFGNQYAFNNPQALEQSFQEVLKIGPTKFDLLYTIFALPNILATFIIGYLIDKVGVRIGIVTLTLGVTIFQLVIAIGGYTQSYRTILIGRMLFGIASQSLVTAQACMISFWFKGKQLAFALGIAITFPQLGNALNSLISPIIYDISSSLGPPLMLSVGICALSTLCAIWAVYLDIRADEHDKQMKLRQEGSESQRELHGAQSQVIKVSDLKELKGSFWLIVFLCMLAVSTYVPFMDNANRLFQKRFCFNQLSAGRTLMITYIVAAVSSAPLGLLVDKVGYKRFFIIGTMGVLTLAQCVFFFYPQCHDGTTVYGAQMGLVLLGLGYAFYANSLVSAIPLVVKKKVTGTAFGIMQMIESFSLGFFPIIAGELVQEAQSPEVGYSESSQFFLLMSLMGVITSLGLIFINSKDKKKLDAKVRTQIQVQEIQSQSNHEVTSDSQHHAESQAIKNKVQIEL